MKKVGHHMLWDAVLEKALFSAQINAIISIIECSIAHLIHIAARKVAMPDFLPCDYMTALRPGYHSPLHRLQRSIDVPTRRMTSCTDCRATASRQGHSSAFEPQSADDNCCDDYCATQCKHQYHCERRKATARNGDGGGQDPSRSILCDNS